MNILVVAPRNSTKVFPVGLAYIVSALKTNGHMVDCINLNLSSELIINHNSYDFVATGGLGCHYADIEDIVTTAKQYGARTILGGGIVSSEPHLITRALQVDYAVIGEGEVTICELLRCLENGGDVSKIEGIAFIRNDEFIVTQSRKPIKDLDSIPLPDYESLGFIEHLNNLRSSDIYIDCLDYFDYPRVYPVVSSRSCPFECTFCYHPLGKIYRQRSIDSIMNEIKEVVPKYEINILEILDELFSFDKKRLREFCARLKEFRDTLPWELKWACQLRVDSIDTETIAMLKESGCYCLSLGLESYSEAVLRSMKKRITPTQIHNAVHLILDTDLRLQGNFIFGDKAETMVTARETIAFWKEHSRAGILLGFVHPYPDSELYRYCFQEGIIRDKLDFIRNHFFDTLNMTEMPDNVFSNLKLEVSIADLKYNRYSIPQKVKPDNMTIRCPHCRGSITYNNFQVVENNSRLFFLPQNKLLFSKMMHCRICGGRFWARSLLAQLLTFIVIKILKYPVVAIGIMNLRNMLFAFLKNKSLREVTRRLKA